MRDGCASSQPNITTHPKEVISRNGNNRRRKLCKAEEKPEGVATVSGVFTQNTGIQLSSLSSGAIPWFWSNGGGRGFACLDAVRIFASSWLRVPLTQTPTNVDQIPRRCNKGVYLLLYLGAVPVMRTSRGVTWRWCCRR